VGRWRYGYYRSSAEHKQAMRLTANGEVQSLLNITRMHHLICEQWKVAQTIERGIRSLLCSNHIADKSKYPYVSVSGDLELRGFTVPYGTRIYFGAYPDYVFRLVDTGGRFRGDKKKIRKPGYEPFDIATEYGSKLGFSGKETVYRIDRSDTLSHRKKPKVA
jgi:hypothetical protein